MKIRYLFLFLGFQIAHVVAMVPDYCPGLIVRPKAIRPDSFDVQKLGLLKNEYAFIKEHTDHLFQYLHTQVPVPDAQLASNLPLLKKNLNLIEFYVQSIKREASNLISRVLKIVPLNEHAQTVKNNIDQLDPFIEEIHRIIEIYDHADQLPVISYVNSDKPWLLNFPDTVFRHIVGYLNDSQCLNLALTNHQMFDVLQNHLSERKELALKEDTINLINDVLPLLPARVNPLQANLISYSSQIAVIGDIHGGYDEVRANVNRLRQENHFFIPNSEYVLKADNYIIFTGDIADRGDQGLQAWRYLLKLKKLNPQQIFICRGNHENSDMAKKYGFFGTLANPDLGEINAGFNNPQDAQDIKDAFEDLFCSLPVAIFLAKFNFTANKYSFGMFCHAGIEDDARPVIKELLDRTLHDPDFECSNSFHPDMDENPDIGFCWSDFHSDITPEMQSSRGLHIKSYNKEFAKQFLKSISGLDYTVDFIAHGHQHEAQVISWLNEPGNAVTWLPAADKQTYCVTSGSVISFLCLSQACNDVNQTGYGIFHTDQFGNWFLTTYIMPNNELGKYLS